MNLKNKVMLFRFCGCGPEFITPEFAPILLKQRLWTPKKFPEAKKIKNLNARALFPQRHGRLTIESTQPLHWNHSFKIFPYTALTISGEPLLSQFHSRNILISFSKISLVRGLLVLPLFTYIIAGIIRKCKKIIC